MGANCCVAARDKPLPNRLSCEVSNYRNIRHSPSWSFRWDNRTHIEDVMDNPSRFSHRNSGNIGSEGKSAVDTETEGLSAEESPSYSLQAPKWRKKVGTAGNSKSFSTDQSPRSNLSPEEKCSIKSSPASYSIAKPSVSIPYAPSSSSSFKTPDPSASTICSLQSNPSSSKKARHSPGYQLSRPISDSNDLYTVGSHGGSSDGWSMQTFSELVAASSQRERWSFDSENPNSCLRSSPQSCRVCSKLLKEKSPWSAQKIVSTNELSVTAVLACGHAYHAECLESVTSEIDRYDPPCPICTNGEKLIPKMKAKSKISRRAVADIDVDLKWSGKSPSMVASSSMKKPFLKRHFSIGSRSVSDSEAMRKKTGFWGRHHRG